MNFVVSVFQEIKHTTSTKLSKHLSVPMANSPQKNHKLRGLFVLHLFWPYCSQEKESKTSIWKHKTRNNCLMKCEPLWDHLLDCNTIEANDRVQKLNANSFSSNISGNSGISSQNSRNAAKKFVFPWVRRTYRTFLAPTPSRGRPPKSLGLGSFLLPGITASKFFDELGSIPSLPKVWQLLTGREWTAIK